MHFNHAIDAGRESRAAGGVNGDYFGGSIPDSRTQSRLLKRFHIYGLIAKAPRSRRLRLTKKGWALLSAALFLKEHVFPALHEQASACYSIKVRRSYRQRIYYRNESSYIKRS